MACRGWYDPWLALAVDADDECVLAVWYRDTGSGSITLPLPRLAGDGWTARVAFPADLPFDLDWSAVHGTLRLGLPGGPAARVIRFDPVKTHG